MNEQPNPSWKPEEPRGVQPFALVKYFSFTSLSVILVASFALTWIFSDNARDTMLSRSESYSRMFAENLNRQVFHSFVIPTFIRFGRIALSDPVQFESLDQMVINITKGMMIEAVTIFDSRENIVSYSTDAALVGKKNIGGFEYKKALNGESTSVLVSNGSMLNLLPGAPPMYCTLKTYVPFRQERLPGARDGEIMGVILVVKDLSEDLEAVVSLQLKVMLLSLGVMGILFAVLSAIVIRANRIMQARAAERQELEKQLHEAQRLAVLGKMIASVSHEIKNPLGIVRSTAEILGKRLAKLAPGNEHLSKIIVDETTRLDGIVREFLDFARPKTPTKALGSLNTLVQRLALFMNVEFSDKQIEFIEELDPELPECPLDGDQLYQVLLNIVFNAIHAMPEGGKLTVRTSTSEENVSLEITDTGSGMPPEKLEQIFIPFFTDKNRGTGLGLAITKNIVEQHKGEITVQSEEGVGTTFTVVLPKE
ncbi:MAG: ATP-binding protein [Candidatus Electrothrix aestuarii]|uniref:histidine kinase n=1 Tax=Candidatus Electrothrix aestuarii TaxID=3062594 RepID=A0AAU8LTS8_9BACT|nr:ATP-binding protein [Candidatus Electrothrix aestuarii]WPD20972.1 MAG: ATP-binding protein [Candidatus Electrothrix sp. GW3-3]